MKEILPNPQNKEKLEKALGTRASFVPSPHPYTGPCSNHDANTATAELLWEPPANKGSIVAPYDYFQVLRKESQGPTTVGEEQWARPDCHITII